MVIFDNHSLYFLSDLGELCPNTDSSCQGLQQLVALSQAMLRLVQLLRPPAWNVVPFAVRCYREHYTPAGWYTSEHLPHQLLVGSLAIAQPKWHHLEMLRPCPKVNVIFFFASLEWKPPWKWHFASPGSRIKLTLWWYCEPHQWKSIVVFRWGKSTQW